jgi:leader peptidase (prepilin peptidase)/N-methyltransferase
MHDLLLLIYAILLSLFVGELIGVLTLAIPIWLQRSWRRQCCCDDLAEAETHAGTHIELTRTVEAIVPCCPDCGMPISGYRRIALLNWLLHKNYCLNCGSSQTSRRLLPQLVVMPMTLFIALRYGLEPRMLILLLQLWGWVAIAFISIRHQLIPNVLTYALLWIGLLASAFGYSIPLEDAVTGAVAGYLSQWLLYHGYKLITKREILGYGAFKGGAAMGAFLGLEIGLTAIAGAYVIKCAENKIQHDHIIGPTGLVPIGHWLALVAIACGLFRDG